jgi:hypothetical protein
MIRSSWLHSSCANLILLKTSTPPGWGEPCLTARRDRPTRRSEADQRSDHRSGGATSKKAGWSVVTPSGSISMWVNPCFPCDRLLNLPSSPRIGGYCGVNWVPQTCPELVDTSTHTG